MDELNDLTEPIDNRTDYGKNTRTQIPNATAVLVLGILSIMMSFCYGIPGLIMSIIALVLAKKPRKLYLANPENWLGYENLKAGRICAIIGLILSILMFLFMAAYIFFIYYMVTHEGDFEDWF